MKEKDNFIYEWCHNCEDEVRLQNKFVVQSCPSCKKSIYPCSMCDMDKVNCNKCELDKDFKKKVLLLKLYHEQIYPEGCWCYITHEKNQNKIRDDLIYYYVEDDLDFDKLKVNDTILLDEEFKILEVGEE